MRIVNSFIRSLSVGGARTTYGWELSKLRYRLARYENDLHCINVTSKVPLRRYKPNVNRPHETRATGSRQCSIFSRQPMLLFASAMTPPSQGRFVLFYRVMWRSWTGFSGCMTRINMSVPLVRMSGFELKRAFLERGWFFTRMRSRAARSRLAITTACLTVLLIHWTFRLRLICKQASKDVGV